MIQTFEIPGRLPGLNEFTNANRANARAGNSLKRDTQDKIGWCIKSAKLLPMGGRVNVHITWIEPNMRRDKDNIRCGIKFILDSLVEMQIIKNDNWTYVGELSDSYLVNRDNPRVIVELEEPCKTTLESQPSCRSANTSTTWLKLQSFKSVLKPKTLGKKITRRLRAMFRHREQSLAK